MTTIYDYGINPLDYNGRPVDVARLTTDSNGNTVLVTPTGEYPLIKIKRVSVTCAGTTVPTGATSTGVLLNTVIEDKHGLADLINEYINVPSDAVAYRISAQGAFAANATGSRSLIVEGWVAGVVWVAQLNAVAVPHATIANTIVLSPGALSITPASIPRLRVAGMQDSGGNLTLTVPSLTIEFICA